MHFICYLLTTCRWAAPVPSTNSISGGGKVGAVDGAESDKVVLHEDSIWANRDQPSTTEISVSTTTPIVHEDSMWAKRTDDTLLTESGDAVKPITVHQDSMWAKRSDTTESTQSGKATEPIVVHEDSMWAKRNTGDSHEEAGEATKPLIIHENNNNMWAKRTDGATAADTDDEAEPVIVHEDSMWVKRTDLFARTEALAEMSDELSALIKRITEVMDEARVKNDSQSF
jgi:hypothetical protein